MGSVTVNVRANERRYAAPVASGERLNQPGQDRAQQPGESRQWKQRCTEDRWFQQAEPEPADAAAAERRHRRREASGYNNPVGVLQSQQGQRQRPAYSSTYWGQSAGNQGQPHQPSTQGTCEQPG